jgi:hypothetical protein
MEREGTRDGRLGRPTKSSYMGRFEILGLAQVLQISKSEERGVIALACDWPLGCCRTGIPYWHTTSNH